MAALASAGMSVELRPKSSRPKASQDRERILLVLRDDKRELFLERVADWNESFPSKAALRALAKRSPDRWAQGFLLMAKLAGFSERLDVHAETLDLSALSGVEVAAHRAVLDAKLKALGGVPGFT